MRLALIAMLVAAAPVAAQAPVDKEPRKPLNLNLEDAMRAQPAIQFGPAPEKKDAAGSLPGLGADARKMEGARTSSESRTPFPRDSEMQNR